MASVKLFLADGGNNNKPPYFVGEYYDFWKIHMQMYLEAQGEEIWNDVQNGPYIPTIVINNEEQPKIKGSWNDNDKKKVLYDKKEKKILASTLGIDVFFWVSNWKIAKEIWDTLEVAHEGTMEVKRSKINTLSQEYEMFRMYPDEINHLMALGKTFTNDGLNLKVLRSLTRAWKPKVTTISEKKSLSKISLTILFEKLQEHELELGRLEKHEDQEKKHKTIALKVESKEVMQDADFVEEEKYYLTCQKFGKFLQKDNNIRFGKGRKTFKKMEASTSNQIFTCFECGKQGHMKADCPSPSNKKGFKGKKNSNQRIITFLGMITKWVHIPTCKMKNV